VRPVLVVASIAVSIKLLADQVGA